MINADVLDAWFPPSPLVLSALDEFKKYSCQTSPPTHAEGLVQAISGVYAIPHEEVLVGAGSSALWFLYASTMLDKSSRVLLIEPSYGEYRHVCANVVGCGFQSLALDRFTLDIGQWVDALRRKRFDLAVLINPNNPTGQAFGRAELLSAIDQVPSETMILIDEAYMDFWNPDESLLNCQGLPPNVTIISSFSKRFALSGLRVAMLRSRVGTREKLSKWTPPWAVSMPGQIAACAALRDLEYYAARYEETHVIRQELKVALEALGLTVLDSCANWLNIEVEGASQFCAVTAEKGLFVRNLGLTAPSLGDRWVRIAVKDRATNERMLGILKGVLAADLSSNSCLV